jgi:hypothetical protein
VEEEDSTLEISSEISKGRKASASDRVMEGQIVYLKIKTVKLAVPQQVREKLGMLLKW